MLPPESWKSHFVSRRRIGDKVIRRAVNFRCQVALAAIVTQQRDAQRRMLSDKTIKETIVSKQRVLAIGNQQHRFNLRGIGVEFAALMAKQSVNRCDADAQQRKEGNVELGDVASCTSAVSPRLSP